MPYVLSYYLTYPVTTGPTIFGTVFPGDSTRLLCDSEMFDQTHFLELIDRLLPDSYLRPLKLQTESGYEIFQSMAAVGAKLSEMAHEAECGLVILYSGGGIKATGAVTFYRESVSAGSVTVKAGTLIYTSKNGRRFVTIEDAVFSGADFTRIAAVQAVAPGYEYNVRGQVNTLAGEVLPGEIDSIEVMLQEPAYGDSTIKVRQHADCTGGYPAWLDGHGSNRGIVRKAGEADDEYRARVRNLPDTVSPAAIRRLLARNLNHLGVPWQVIETWDIRYQTCWDAPSSNAGTPTYQAEGFSNPLYNEDLFVYDDPRGIASYANRWLGLDDYLGAFIVVIGAGTVVDYGMAFDDTATSPAQFRDPSTGRQRGTPAYDVPAPLSALVQPGVLDGVDVARAAAIAALAEELTSARPIGITSIVDLLHTW